MTMSYCLRHIFNERMRLYMQTHMPFYKHKPSMTIPAPAVEQRRLGKSTGIFYTYHVFLWPQYPHCPVLTQHI